MEIVPTSEGYLGVQWGFNTCTWQTVKSLINVSHCDYYSYSHSYIIRKRNSTGKISLCLCTCCSCWDGLLPVLLTCKTLTVSQIQLHSSGGFLRAENTDTLWLGCPVGDLRVWAVSGLFLYFQSLAEERREFLVVWLKACTSQFSLIVLASAILPGISSFSPCVIEILPILQSPVRILSFLARRSLTSQPRFCNLSAHFPFPGTWRCLDVHTGLPKNRWDIEVLFS